MTDDSSLWQDAAVRGIGPLSRRWGPGDVSGTQTNDTAVVQDYLRTHRLAIYVPAYNGARKIVEVFERIPPFLWGAAAEVFVVDDGSTDGTREVVLDYKARHARANLNVLRREENRGYGASQKLAYRYAIERGYDLVAMLHCDAQYAPEEMPRLLARLIESGAGMIFGSRFTGDPLAGNMPRIRYYGVHFLNVVQNAVLRWNLSEYTSGYRIFRTDALRQVPFERCSDYYHFDTEIFVQFRLKGIPVAEDTIPTHYGDEENYVNIYKNGLLILAVMGEYLLHRLKLRRSPKFEV